MLFGTGAYTFEWSDGGSSAAFLIELVRVLKTRKNALTIELLNIRLRKVGRTKPVDLHEAYEPEAVVERCPECGALKQPG